MKICNNMPLQDLLAVPANDSLRMHFSDGGAARGRVTREQLGRTLYHVSKGQAQRILSELSALAARQKSN